MPVVFSADASMVELHAGDQALGGLSDKTFNGRPQPLRHLRFNPDPFPVHNETAISVMMDGPGVFLRRIGPGLEDLQDEEIELVHQMSIDHPTFKIGEALS